MAEEQERMHVAYGPTLKVIKRATGGASLVHFGLEGDSPGTVTKASFKANGWEDTGVENFVRVSLTGIGANQGKTFTASFDHVEGGGFLVQDN